MVLPIFEDVWLVDLVGIDVTEAWQALLPQEKNIL